MTHTEYLLASLAEECAEVAQRATKALRFGVTEVQPGQPLNNAERIMDELEDILVIVTLLHKHGVLSMPSVNRESVDRKVAKVMKYMEYATKCGTLTSNNA